MERIPFKIDRLQVLLISQFALNLVEAGELVVRTPQLLQVCQLREMREFADPVVGEIEDAQCRVGLQTAQVGQGIVCDVEFL